MSDFPASERSIGGENDENISDIWRDLATFIISSMMKEKIQIVQFFAVFVLHKEKVPTFCGLFHKAFYIKFVVCSL